MGDQTKDKPVSTQKLSDYILDLNNNKTEDNDGQEPDALHREVQGGGGAERIERVSDNGAGDQVDWRKELQTAFQGIQELKKLEGKTDPESQQRVRELTDRVDIAFQQALPMIRDNATQADAGVLGKAMQFTNMDQERKQILQELGFPPNAQLQGDDLKNAILNAPNDALRNKLTQLETLNEMQALTANQAGQQLELRHLPYRVGLEYANFLSEYRPNGITADIRNPQQVYSALDVLLSVNSPEMQAAGGGEAIRRASDRQAENANQILPADENPLVYLQTALTSQNPTEALAAAKKAAELAEGINPADAQKKVEELKAQLNGVTDATQQQNLQQQIMAWDALSHSGAVANPALGRLLMTQQPPDWDGARAALLKASKDSVGAMLVLDERGQPIFTSLMMLSMTKGDQSMVQKIEGAGQTLQQAQQKAAEAEREQNDEKKKQLLEEASRLGNEAIQQSKLLSQAFGGKTGQELASQIAELEKKPENQRSEEDKFTLEFLKQIKQLGEMEAGAMASVASWDMARGDGRAAERLLNDLEQNHPEFFAGKDETFRNQFKELKNGASSLAEDQDISEMSNWNPLKWGRKAWKFCEDNAKWIAFGVAAAVAVGVTIATAGAGAPVGLAILAGAGAGLVGGTVVGGGLEWSSGRENNLWDGMKRAAPYAAAGAAVGSGGAYFFAPAGAAAGLGVAHGFFGTLGAGFATGTAGGAFWNAGKVRDAAELGKYDNWQEAATDWGTGTLAWGANGALAAAPLSWGAKGLWTLKGAHAAGELTTRVMVGEGIKVAGAGLTAATFPNLVNGAHTWFNWEATKVTGHLPRWLGNTAGLTNEQIAAFNETGGRVQETGTLPPETQAPPQQRIEQPVQPQPQQVERTADPGVQIEQPAQPSTYRPGQANYEDYYK
jgi:hypothetical protein